jgi:hypothetical protein
MHFIVFITALLLFSPALAQDAPVNELPRALTDYPDDKFLTFVFENDSIGRGDDQNYTNGVRLTYFDLNANFPAFAHKIADAVPTFDLNRTSSIYYSIGQNLYTPDDISSRTQDPDDRPWAGFLYGSVGMATLTGNHIDELEATVGIVGPLALGEQVQKAVHKHITDSPIPKGWNNQLENEPGLILSWQRRWPRAFYAETNGLTLTASPYFGTSLGNIYTYGAAGLSFRLSSSHSQWSDTPVRVRPAMPGTGFFEVPERGWDWYLFAGVEGRAVARNIFIDGNTFEDSHDADKKILLGDANAGIAFTFGRARLSYTLVYRTKEFEQQNRADLFGALSLAYRF